MYTACSCRLTSSDLAYIINDCGARVFITSRYKADQAAEVVPETPEVEVRLMLECLRGTGTPARVLAAHELAAAGL